MAEDVRGVGRHLFFEFFELVIFLLPVIFYLFLCFAPGVFDALRPVWSRGQVV